MLPIMTTSPPSTGSPPDNADTHAADQPQAIAPLSSDDTMWSRLVRFGRRIATGALGAASQPQVNPGAPEAMIAVEPLAVEPLAADRKILVAAIVRLAQNDPELTRLDLSHKRLGGENIKDLVYAVQRSSHLTELALCGNPIGRKGARALATLLVRRSTLQTLALYGNQIDERGALYLAHALEINRTLSTLLLGANRLGNEGAEQLADTLRNNGSLTVLDLHDNQIGDLGAQALADALRYNASLVTLDLHANQIGETGGQALLDAVIPNERLIHLYLQGNPISDSVKAQLHLALALTPLRVRLNRLSSHGLELAKWRRVDEAIPLLRQAIDLHRYIARQLALCPAKHRQFAQRLQEMEQTYSDLQSMQLRPARHGCRICQPDTRHLPPG